MDKDEILRSLNITEARLAEVEGYSPDLTIEALRLWANKPGLKDALAEHAENKLKLEVIETDLVGYRVRLQAMEVERMTADFIAHYDAEEEEEDGGERRVISLDIDDEGSDPSDSESESENEPELPDNMSLSRRRPSIEVAGGWASLNKNNFPHFISDTITKSVLDRLPKLKFGNEGHSPFLQQQFVTQFMNNSPYRGVLLYHGLGSGKSGASISIAESMSNRQAIILLPASIKGNYVKEIVKWSENGLLKQNHWVLREITNASQLALKLHITVELLDTLSFHDHIWLINNEEEGGNFDTLDEAQRKRIELQIKRFNEWKYTYAHYNGSALYKQVIKGVLGETIWEELEANITEKKHEKQMKINNRLFHKISTDEVSNPFDNKIVIVDEIHNLINTIAKTDIKDGIQAKSIYELIMRAENCKIVALSGTPAINKPYELAILFNLLRGLIKGYNFNLKNSVLPQTIKERLNNKKYIDNFKIDRVNNKLEIIRPPFGFQLNEDEDKLVKNPLSEDTFMTTILKDTKSILKDEHSEIKYYTIFPSLLLNENRVDSVSFLDIMSSLQAPKLFEHIYITKDKETKKEKIFNEEAFRNRIIGLVSHYNEINEPGIFPTKKESAIRPEMSTYQYDRYKEAADWEYEYGKKIAKLKRMIPDIENNLFRAYTRQVCNFAFPTDNPRPDPKDYKGRKKQYSIDLQQTIEGFPDEVLTADLNDYSPKYYRILEKIMNTEGLVLLYSNYISGEGIGIFEQVLLRNGFTKFDPNPDSKPPIQVGAAVRIQTEDASTWITSKITHIDDETNEATIKDVAEKYTFDPTTNEFARADVIGLATYTLFTGGEDTETRELSIDSFNEHDNRYGKDILIFMITQAGAEGISLKNVREVHLLEPHWNKVRTEQAIGRARRIRSHHDLPKDQRDVTVYEYLMRIPGGEKDSIYQRLLVYVNTDDYFKDNQDPTIEEIFARGYGKRGVKWPENMPENLKKYLLDRGGTTDEHIERLGRNKKELINSFFTLIKEAAIDCTLHKEDNDTTGDQTIKCLPTEPKPEKTKNNYDIFEIQAKKDLRKRRRVVTRGITVIDFNWIVLDKKINLIVKGDISADTPIYNYFTYFGIGGEEDKDLVIGSISIVDANYEATLNIYFVQYMIEKGRFYMRALEALKEKYNLSRLEKQNKKGLKAIQAEIAYYMEEQRYELHEEKNLDILVGDYIEEEEDVEEEEEEET
jgi:hypothetical protein